MRHTLGPALIIALLLAMPAAGNIFLAASKADNDDINPGDGKCDSSPLVALTICGLRTAIQEANALPGLDIITLTAGTYTLTQTGSQDDNSANGDLDIVDDLIIAGPGADVTVIDGLATGERILDIPFIPQNPFLGTVEISGVTFANAESEAGAAIRSFGNLTIERCWFRNNRGTNGGAIFAEGTNNYLISDSTFSGNRAAYGGALLIGDGSVEVTNTTFSGNVASRRGGAIYLDLTGSLHLRTSTLTLNQAPVGSAVYTQGSANFPSPVFNSTKTLYDGTCDGEGLSVVYGGDGGNLESPGSTCFAVTTGDQVSVPQSQLLLGGLGMYGGKTPTHALSSQSVAVDPPLSFAVCPPTDQRSTPRSDFSCDVGAVERQSGEAEPPMFVDGFESGDTSMWTP